MPTTPRILIVDDEAPLRSLLERTLAEEGFETQSIANGPAALNLLSQGRYDLVLLDLMLPGLSGESICQQIRKDPRTRDVAILMITGAATEGVEAKMLNIGADDFIAKPFERRDMVAHVRALLRRPPMYVCGDYTIRTERLVIHVGKHRVLFDNRPVQGLAPKEFELLKLIAQSAPNVLEKSELAQRVWGLPLEQLHYRTLDVHIQRVRRKLGATAAQCLKTIPAIGYQWWESS